MVSIFRSSKSQQEEWKRKTIEYATAVNGFVERGLRDGWEKAGNEPTDNDREQLVPELIRSIRRANTKRSYEDLRQEWPLAHSPLIAHLETNGVAIPTLALLEGGAIAARIGAPYEDGRVVVIDGETVTNLPGFMWFGACPNRRFYAYADGVAIWVTDGWLGSEVGRYAYPTGLEGAPDGYWVVAHEEAPKPTALVPFPSGDRVLFVASEGIFVLNASGADRLLPTAETMKEHFDWLRREDPAEPLSMDIDMEHGAISRDGRWIAVGSQDSVHLVFDANLELIAQVGNLIDYPHYAVFSHDDAMLALNSCHFYNGATLGVATSRLPGLVTEPYEPSDITPVLEHDARVYAAVSRADEFIVGEAYGYLRAFSQTGEPRWQHHIGSTVGAMDISADGKTLVCSTYAGFISILELDGDNTAPYEIGTGGHHERRRWLFWKGERRPLIW